MKRISANLKPCPFCGGKAELSTFVEHGMLVAMIICTEYCGAVMRTDNFMTLDDHDDNNAESLQNRVILGWNSRSNEKHKKGSLSLRIWDN